MIPTLIGLMPTTVQITRHSKVRSSGGYEWVETDLDSIEIRLYDYGHDAREFNTIEGEVKLLTHGLLAESDADIIVGHDSYDTFDIPDEESPTGYRKFRIYSKRVYDDINIDAQIQCACGAV